MGGAFKELGHVVANTYHINSMDVAKEVLETNSTVEVIEFVTDNLSKYAGEYEDGREIVSECFASVYGSNIENEFALKFLEKCGKFK